MCDDVMTRKTIELMREELARQSKLPQVVPPFIIRTTREGAASFLEQHGIELDLNEKGEQLIGHYLIVTR